MHAQSKPVILVIDPDVLTMTAVAASLHLAGYESHCAQDAEAARKAGKTLSLDLIIADINVGGDNGIELVQEIRQNAINSDVPVMYASAMQLPDIIRKAHDGGGTYYLRKPFDPNVLLELVDKALWMPHLIKNKLGHHMGAAMDNVNQSMPQTTI